ncbi:1,3-beta-glucanosyltransferase [Aspergillus luchuensis]|uniref:1,3-beta-glucanosyltransferase n=1 Tax=Aspergillus kawachii TaxID=1069201 RepID=A0A146FD42_ASPKA|nr:1,3-beta-glucanosyltransferase [Aspergillus luchuensis]
MKLLTILSTTLFNAAVAATPVIDKAAREIPPKPKIAKFERIRSLYGYLDYIVFGVVFMYYRLLNEIGLVALITVSPVPVLFFQLESMTSDSLELGAMADLSGEAIPINQVSIQK